MSAHPPKNYDHTQEISLSREQNKKEIQRLIGLQAMYQPTKLNTFCAKKRGIIPQIKVIRDLKQEKAVKKTRWSTGKFPFKWN